MEFDEKEYHVPTQCKCGCQEFRYNGLGEYICTKCGASSYNEYGVVRNYIENHKGATAPKIAKETGVPISMIHRMIAEEKFDFTGSRHRFLK